MKRVIVLAGLAAAALMVVDFNAYGQYRIVTTADPGGADVELRESQPTTNRGSSTEIASRIDNREESYFQRNSLIYLKFGVQNITPGILSQPIWLCTTYRNANIYSSRIEDTAGLNGGENTGFDYYVLDPTAPGADWDEMTITPQNAPGYYLDGDMGTKATHGIFGMLNPELSYLGFNQFESYDLVGASPHMPVGGAFALGCGEGSALHNAIVAAQGTDHKTVTIVMGIAHPASGVDDNWLGFNYLFNPKEMTTLNNDPDSWWGGASNADNMFSPQLWTLPEPTTLALLGLGGLLLRRKH